MELTKEQIQFIDYRLENDGIKYWDVRIELLDHTVSYVEKRLTQKEDFKKLVHEAFVNLGWKGTFSHLNKLGWKNTNRLYRSMYLRGFINFFKNSLNILFFILFFVVFYFLSNYLTHKTFLKVSYIIFLLPMLVFFYAAFKTWRKKYGKSVHKDYALSYLMLSFLILNGVMTFIKVDVGFSIPIEFHKPVLFLIIPLHLILTFSGYQVYKKGIARVEKMRKELLT